jgi:DegV family protein with EDD domain
MEQFKIVTDSTADLPQEFLDLHNIGCLHLSYILDGVTYGRDKKLDCKEFYAMMRTGKMPTTSQVNPDEAKTAFYEFKKENKQILYLAFSSGLSGTYNSGAVAAKEVMEEDPECKIVVIDTLAASLGEGLLVYQAVQMRQEGKTLEETEAWIRQHILNLVHAFTVDDLFHLFRGGRVSKAAAILGTLASVKPQMHVDDEGHLVLVGKVRGRKKSLQGLVDYMDKHLGSYRDQNKVAFISHGDCQEDAEYVRDLVKDRFGIESFIINYVGPTIGAHSGPGTLALFFFGDKR